MPNGNSLDELNLIPFVGELRAKVLKENGIKDVETLLKYPIEKLAQLDGFSMKIAQKIRKYAAEVESMGLVGKEPIKELILKEFRCPRCDAIVSSGESICHRCGKKFLNMPENAEDLIVNSHFEILKDPDNPQLWKKRAMILENLGLHDEATISMLKLDFLEMFEGEKKPKKEKKVTVKKGLVNGNGIVANNGVVGGLFPRGKGKNTLPLLIALMIILPIIILSTSIATKGIEIDGSFSDWKPIKGIEIYSESKIIDEVKYYTDSSTFLYIKFSQDIFSSPEKYYYTTLAIFFDTDLKNNTGYKVGGIGADKLLLIYGYDGKIKSAKIMDYAGSGIDWRWKNEFGVRMGYNGKEMELSLPSLHKFYAFCVYKNIYTEYISGIFSTEKGVFCTIEDDESSVVSQNDEVCKINIFPISTQDQKISLKLINKGNSSGASFDIIDASGNILSKNGEVSNLDVRKLRSLTVVYAGGGESGSTIYMDVKIDGTLSFIKNFARGKYIDALPAKPSFDGIYADWKYTNDKGDCKDKDIDIIGGAIYSRENTTIISFGVAGNLLKGSYVPISLYMDRDRDTIPDPIDKYPDDFNNDGIPDAKSKTSDGKPDVDKDGIADYPYGNDTWLNTTVNGREVSVKLGGKSNPTIGKGYITISFLNDNKIVKKVKIEGFDGKIINSSLNKDMIAYNNRYMELICSVNSNSVRIEVQCMNYFDDEFIKSELSKYSHTKKEELSLSNESVDARSKAVELYYLGKFDSPILLANFGTDVKIDSSGNDTVRPTITQTSDGMLWVTYDRIYYGKHYIYLANSSDNGATWTVGYFSGIPMNDYCYPVISHDDQNHVYIFFENRTSGSYFSYLRRDPSTGNWYIYSISTWNWWSSIRNISVWIKGSVIWLAVEYIYSSTDYDIRWLLSSNSGSSWSYGTLAATTSMEIHPSVAVSDSYAVIAYQVQSSSGDWNITVKHSDGVTGYNFSESSSTGDYNTSSNNEFNPSLYAYGNYVYLAWEKVYSATDTDISVMNSNDGGATFGGYTYFSLSGDNEKYPSIALANGNHIMVVYVNVTTGSLCAAESTDGGTNWKIYVVNDTYTTWKTAAIYRCSHIIYSGGYFYIVWTEEWSSTDRDIFFDKTVNEGLYNLIFFAVLPVPLIRRIKSR